VTKKYLQTVYFSKSKLKSSKKKYEIKIPKNIKVLYCDKRNLIIFIGPLATRSLSLKIKLFLIPSSNLIIITNLLATKKYRSTKKYTKKLQGLTAAKIKQNLIEATNLLSRKLNLTGIGYHVSFYEKKIPNQLCFKLAYSHLLYFKIPIELRVNCFKFTKLLLSNNSYDSLTQIAAQIKNCKLPEAYKGKGISYEDEALILKKSKKI